MRFTVPAGTSSARTGVTATKGGREHIAVSRSTIALWIRASTAFARTRLHRTAASVTIVGKASIAPNVTTVGKEPIARMTLMNARTILAILSVSFARTRRGPSSALVQKATIKRSRVEIAPISINAFENPEKEG